MKINISDKPSAQLNAFAQSEWPIYDIEHYGRTTDWDTRHCYFEAWEQNELVGIAVCKGLLNVFEVEQLLIKHTRQRKGLGRKLLQEIEKFCIQNNYHKIFLTTGIGWKAEHFYDALGYERTTLLKKHYLQKDFILYSKFLKV